MPFITLTPTPTPALHHSTPALHHSIPPSSLKPNLTKTSRQMKIELIHRRPRGPMRMRHFLRAFEKIPAPHLAGNMSQLSGKRLKQAKRDKELQRPNRRLRNLLFYNPRKRCPNLNQSANLPRDFCKRFKTGCSPFRVNNVRTQKSPAAIEFKIEVAAIRFWLHEKFDTTVLPHFIEIVRSNAPDMSIMH
jgi:hypothetical protein